MARLPRQDFTNVGDRVGEILLHVIDGGAPVPGFDVIGPDVDNGVEELDGKIEVLAVDRGLDPAHQQRGGVAAGREPERPDPVLYIFCTFVARRDLKRLEQLVEVLPRIALLRTRKISRRLDWLGRLGGRRLQRRLRRHGRGQNRGKRQCGG